MISAGVLHRLPSERATEPFALLRVLPRRRFIARYAGLRSQIFLKPDSASSANFPTAHLNIKVDYSCVRVYILN